MSAVPRSLPIALAALVVAALGTLCPAEAAFAKVDREKPIQAGRGYVYYLHEVDTNKQSVAGRTVTMKVGAVPGPGASVAVSDADGHLAGPAGATASAVSGADGLVHFVLRISTTPGDNEFIWDDGSYQGQVLITGLAPGATAAASGGAAPSGGGGTHRHAGTAISGGGGPTAAQLAGRLPARRVPPLAAALAAAALCWVVLPGVFARRRGGLLAPVNPITAWSTAAPPR